MNIYMAVDLKDNELPYAVADTHYELARMCGVKPNTILVAIANVKSGRAKRSRYVRVELEGEDE